MFKLTNRIVLMLVLLPMFGGCALGLVGVGSGDMLMDPVIAGKVESAFKGDPQLSQRKISVVVNGGVVTLHGRVLNQAEEQKAIYLAEQAFGVKITMSKLELVDAPPKQLAKKPAKPTTRQCSHQPTEAVSGNGRITTSGLNVRSGIGTKCSRIAVLSPQEIFTLQGKRGNWYQIRLSSGMKGWVYGPMIEQLERSASTLPAE